MYILQQRDTQFEGKMYIFQHSDVRGVTWYSSTVIPSSREKCICMLSVPATRFHGQSVRQAPSHSVDQPVDSDIAESCFLQLWWVWNARNLNFSVFQYSFLCYVTSLTLARISEAFAESHGPSQWALMCRGLEGLSQQTSLEKCTSKSMFLSKLPSYQVTHFYNYQVAKFLNSIIT